jgi:GntR family transcriptional regulator, transcriptional repressor for pyruvate dehydrogenase complex
MLKLGQLGRTPHLPARVSRMISQEILEGRLKPGDRLPTEQALAEALGVSRNVVREAIARLRSEGVVESRQGVGAFVVDATPRGVLRLDSAELRDPGNFAWLLELRALLEIDAAGLAALRHDPDHLARIEAALELMRGAARWSEASVRADLDFHRAIAVATGNGYLVVFLSFLSEQMRESIELARARDDLDRVVEQTIAEHEAILRAIRARDAAGAREAARRHISAAAGRLGLERPMAADGA